MAMYYKNESIEIIVPNSEAFKGAQLKGIKDSTVGGYYIQDDPVKKQYVLDFFDGFKLDFKIDISSLEKYVKDVKKKVYSSRVLFKGELKDLDSNLNFIKDNHGVIPKMCYTGTNGRYLSFNNEDKVVNALRNIILGDITKITIEKQNDSFIVQLSMLEDYMAKLCKKVNVDNAEQLGKILKEYYDKNKKSGIHLFGFDYSYIIRDEVSIKDIINASGIPESYSTEINNGVNLRRLLDERNYYIDNDKSNENQFDSPLTNTNQINIKYNTGLISEFNQNRILFGAPGTGKSYTLNEEKDMLLSDEKNYERVTFHPDYSYANFVGSYKPVSVYNEATKKKDIEYKYVPGPFMRTLVKALRSGSGNSPEIFLLIIEEINRANVAAVFGDVFQLLDRKNGVSEYPIQTSEDMRQYLAQELGGNPADYEEIRIPDNMYIWATMNSADQGVYPMDTAFKRRWDFTYIGINDAEDEIKDKKIVLNGTEYKWNSIRKGINDTLSTMNINEDKLLGPYFINMDNIDKDEEFDEIFKNKVLMYLFEDAGRQRRSKIFKEGLKVYSSVCKEYDENKLEVFINDILDVIDKYEKE